MLASCQLVSEAGGAHVPKVYGIQYCTLLHAHHGISRMHSRIGLLSINARRIVPALVLPPLAAVHVPHGLTLCLIIHGPRLSVASSTGSTGPSLAFLLLANGGSMKPNCVGCILKPEPFAPASTAWRIAWVLVLHSTFTSTCCCIRLNHHHGTVYHRTMSQKTTYRRHRYIQSISGQRSK